jgi:hypothetical protein
VGQSDQFVGADGSGEGHGASLQLLPGRRWMLGAVGIDQVEAVPEVPDSGVGHVVDVDSPADLDVLGGAEVVKRRADQDIAGTR